MRHHHGFQDTLPVLPGEVYPWGPASRGCNPGDASAGSEPTSTYKLPQEVGQEHPRGIESGEIHP